MNGLVNMDTSGFSVDGLSGTWHTIDHMDIDGHTFWLMEHDTHPNAYECIIVNEQGSPCLTRVSNEFNEHTVDLLRQELMPVTRMPDETISVEEMKAYGYAWGGMLPMREEAAVKLWGSDICPVYRLYEDDSEGMIMDADEFRSHAEVGGIFGIEKVDWLRILEKDSLVKEALASQIQSASKRSAAAQPILSVNDKEGIQENESQRYC